MKLSKSKRQHLRKCADEHSQKFLELNFPVDELLDFVDSLQCDHDDLKSKLTTERKLVAALSNLQIAITNLTTAVDNAVTALGAPPVTGVPEADVQAAADAVTVQTGRLVTATPPPPAPS